MVHQTSDLRNVGVGVRGDCITSFVCCGPVYLRFQPEAGRRYRVQFEQEDRVCDARVLDVTAAGSTAEAAMPAGVAYSRWLCTEGFMGIGMNEVIGYREFAS